MRSKAVSYRLRLYINGTSPKSAAAMAALQTICREHLNGAYELEVIDFKKHPIALMNITS